MENNILLSNPEMKTNGSERSEKSDGGPRIDKCDVFIKSCFKYWGHLVARYPVIFILIPLIICGSLGYGIRHAFIEDDPEILFSTKGSQYEKDANKFYSYFNHAPNVGKVIVKAKDGGSVLRQELSSHIIDLNDKIINMKVQICDDIISYKDVCSKVNNSCLSNIILLHFQNNISIPLDSFTRILGGIEEQDGLIKNSEALMLIYQTNINDSSHNCESSSVWESEILSFLKNYTSSSLNLSFSLGRSLKDEYAGVNDLILNFIIIHCIIMTFNMSLNFSVGDVLRNKFYVGIFGMGAFLMSCVSAFGVLGYSGIPFLRFNLVIVLIGSAITIENLYLVVLYSYEKTSYKEPVPLRIAEAYSEASLYILMGTIATLLPICIGAATPIFIVQNFCLHFVLVQIFGFIFTMTFSGGILTLSSYLESDRRHAVFLCKLNDSDPKREKDSCCWNFWKGCCFGSSLNRHIEDSKTPIKPFFLKKFFRDKVSILFFNNYCRVVFAALLLIYYAGAIYGLTTLSQNIKETQMFSRWSYLNEFYKDEKLYFSNKAIDIQLVTSGNSLSSSSAQSSLLNLLSKIKKTSAGKFVPILDENDHFRSNDKLEQDNSSSIKEFEKNIMKNLHVKPHIKLSGEDNAVDAIKFTLQFNGPSDISKEKDNLITIIDETGVDAFVFIDDISELMKIPTLISISALLIAELIVLLTAASFLRIWQGFLIVVASSISIMIGVIGFTSLWYIKIDQFSLMAFLICIGHSATSSMYVVHLYYSLSGSEKFKVKEIMFHMGFHTFQHSNTIIQCIMVLLIMGLPFYGFQALFKIIVVFTFVRGFCLYYTIMALTTLSLISKRFSKNNKVEPSLQFRRTENVISLNYRSKNTNT